MRRLDTVPAPFAPGADFERKVREFARQVAKRHRGRPLDPAQLVVALRGYHRALAVVAEVPPLDDSLLALAVAEYRAARGVRRPAAA